VAKFVIAWTERYEKVIERPTLEDAAQHAKFAVAQKPGAVLLSVVPVAEPTEVRHG